MDWALAGVAVVGFSATSVDNFVALVGLLSANRSRRREIAIAYLGALVLSGVACVGLARLAAPIPVAHLRWLGLIPVAVGVVGLAQLWRSNAPNATPPGGESVIVATLVAMLAQNADTVLVFAALMADSTISGDIIVIAVLASLGTLFLVVALAISRRAAQLPFFERYGNVLAPILMILVGAFIWLDTSADMQ